MKTRQSNHTMTVLSFLVALLVIGVLHLIIPEEDISLDEGRSLNHFPKLIYADALTGQSAVKIEKWYNDQFPFRQSFIQAGKAWRSVAYPNLNADGLAIYLIPDEQGVPIPEPEPTEPPATEPSTGPTEPQGTDPTDPPEPTEPPLPPPLDPVDDVISTKLLLIINQRAMERYYGNEERLKTYAGKLNTLDQKLGDGVQLYSLIAPTAIELFAPDEHHSGYSSQKLCIGIVNEALDDKVISVNAYDKLLFNRDRYIYYRTDHHWTGLGAYYAYTAFCESAGLQATALEDMEHYQIEGTYLGSLYRVSKNEVLKNNPDTTEGWKPNAEYTATAWDNSEMTVTYKIRLNDERIKGSNSYLNFSGGDRALLKIETDHTIGRKILVVKDSFGNAFVPYLANHFDEVYVVDPRYYVRSINKLVADNGITDVLILNYMFGTSNATWLKGFDLIAK
ncbi:MAG: DHHW family protein [Saccharofermentanales bacterium]